MAAGAQSTNRSTQTSEHSPRERLGKLSLMGLFRGLGKLLTFQGSCNQVLDLPRSKWGLVIHHAVCMIPQH